MFSLAISIQPILSIIYCVLSTYNTTIARLKICRNHVASHKMMQFFVVVYGHGG